MDHLAVADQHRALERVLQLADVAGPVVAHQHVDGLGGDALDALAVRAGILEQEVVGQHHHVGPSLAQRRHEDGEDVQAVIEVLPEGLLGDGLLEVLVGGGDQADIHLDGLGAAQPFQLPFLDHAEQLHLRRQVELADLVEEEGASFGQLEAALLAARRAGEGARLVAEQLALDQRLRQRRAADLEKRLLGAGRVVVQRVRDQLLAGARFAADEDGGVGARHLLDLLVRLLHGPAGADDVAEVVALLQLALELAVLVEQAGPLFLDHPVHLEALRDHRGHHAEEPGGALEVAALLELEVHRQRAGRLAVEHDGDADERQLGAARGLPLRRRAVEEERLAADLRNDDVPAALDHPPGDALAQPVARPLALGGDAERRLDVELVRLRAEQHHRAAHHLVVLLQPLEDPQQPGLEVGRARQGLAHLEQGGELADLFLRVGLLFHLRSSSA